MIDRIVLIALGIFALGVGVAIGRRDGWLRVIGEFPFAFVAIWSVAGGLALLYAGIVTPWS